MASDGPTHAPPSTTNLGEALVKLTAQELHVALGELKRLEALQLGNANVAELVRDLPKQTQHDVIVPMSDVAFMPGQLVETDKLTLGLGQGYFAERTPAQAAEFLGRKATELGEQTKAVRAHIDELRARLQTAAATADVLDIREEYDPAQHGPLPGSDQPPAPSTSGPDTGQEPGPGILGPEPSTDGPAVRDRDVHASSRLGLESGSGRAGTAGTAAHSRGPARPAHGRAQPASPAGLSGTGRAPGAAGDPASRGAASRNGKGRTAGAEDVDSDEEFRRLMARMEELELAEEEAESASPTSRDSKIKALLGQQPVREDGNSSDEDAGEATDMRPPPIRPPPFAAAPRTAQPACSSGRPGSAAGSAAAEVRGAGATGASPSPSGQTHLPPELRAAASHRPGGGSGLRRGFLDAGGAAKPPAKKTVPRAVRHDTAVMGEVIERDPTGTSNTPLPKHAPGSVRSVVEPDLNPGVSSALKGAPHLLAELRQSSTRARGVSRFKQLRQLPDYDSGEEDSGEEDEEVEEIQRA